MSNSIFLTATIASFSFFFYKTISYIFLKEKNSHQKLDEVDTVKTSILDMMKNTPLIYIKSLSEITGCNIFAKCEYILPYSSKDRMIKNIMINARE